MTNSNSEPRALSHFEPAQSGNLCGRRKSRPISERYAELAERELPEKDRIKHRLPEGATYGDALAIVMFKAALEGKPDAVREIREAIEGRTGHRQEREHLLNHFFQTGVPPSLLFSVFAHGESPVCR